MSVPTAAREQRNLRFEFGQNWSRFVGRNLDEERIGIARKHILNFLKREDLTGLDFLDIGSGSGINSAAALSAGAGRILSFDYDPKSVTATNIVCKRAGNPRNWHVVQGDVLDDSFVGSLGKWNFVYSWGVLHHTGDVWRAIENASSTVADEGLFYIALYSVEYCPVSHVRGQPDPDFWLQVKREYNLASSWKKRRMVWWYVWRYIMGGKLRNFRRLVGKYVKYRFSRGMNLFVDIRDWLGGWPMEFTHDQDVVKFVSQRGFTLQNIKTGEANTEFLFVRNP